MYAEQMLGKYHLIAEIARGGMGVVYLALVQGPGGFSKLVVVKELKTDLVEDPTFLTMFLDEARLAARLNHPNIVQTNEVGNEGDRHFMAMDYLDGRTYERVRRRAKNAHAGSLTLPMQVHVVCNVLAALEYAHNLADFDGSPLEVVHRDVSPNNVFITFDGHVKVLDFGIAKAADHEHETVAGAVKGKLTYMAPEQARGQKVDRRADVYSVGVILWEAVAGRRLRTGSHAELVRTAGGEEAPSVSTIVPDVPYELDAIIARALANNREDRYASAADFHAALEAYLTKQGPVPTAREIGAVVAKLFRDERAKVTAQVETYVTRARNGVKQASEELPVIELSGGLSPATPIPERTGSLDTPTSVSGDFGSASLVMSAGGENVESAGGSLPPQRTLAPISRRGSLLTMGGIAVVAIAVAAYAFGRSGSAKPTTAAETSPPSAMTVQTPTERREPAPEPLPIIAPAAIGVEIRAKPASATISIDGALVSGNPFRGNYREDGVMHRIRVTAAGFETATRDVSFDRDVLLEFDLPKPAPVASRVARPVRTPREKPAQRVAVPALVPVAPVPEKAGPPKPAPDQINPAGGQKPRRTIDAKNPYQTP